MSDTSSHGPFLAKREGKRDVWTQYCMACRKFREDSRDLFLAMHFTCLVKSTSRQLHVLIRLAMTLRDYESQIYTPSQRHSNVVSKYTSTLFSPVSQTVYSVSFFVAVTSRLFNQSRLFKSWRIQIALSIILFAKVYSNRMQVELLLWKCCCVAASETKRRRRERLPEKQFQRQHKHELKGTALSVILLQVWCLSLIHTTQE